MLLLGATPGLIQYANPSGRAVDQAHLQANRLTFADGDLSGLEAAVVGEFERAVWEYVLPPR